MTTWKQTLSGILALLILLTLAGCDIGKIPSVAQKPPAETTSTTGSATEATQSTVPTGNAVVEVPPETTQPPETESKDETRPTEPPAVTVPETKPTQPAETTPPATKPPETVPPTTQPPASTEPTQPPTTQPPPTDPPATETSPPVTEPATSPATEPVPTAPPPTEPEETTPPPTEETVQEKPKPTEQFKQEVAYYAAYYINQYRTASGAPACTILPGMTNVAAYRADQLTYNYSHDTEDKREALAYYEYGRWVDATIVGLDPSASYYEADTSEAICAGFEGKTAEEMGKYIADLCRNSSSHWSYIGSSKNLYIGVGVEYRAGSTYGWYGCIMVGRTNYG